MKTQCWQIPLCLSMIVSYVEHLISCPHLDYIQCQLWNGLILLCFVLFLTRQMSSTCPLVILFVSSLGTCWQIWASPVHTAHFRANEADANAIFGFYWLSLSNDQVGHKLSLQLEPPPRSASDPFLVDWALPLPLHSPQCLLDKMTFFILITPKRSRKGISDERMAKFAPCW